MAVPTTAVHQGSSGVEIRAKRSPNTRQLPFCMVSFRPINDCMPASHATAVAMQIRASFNELNPKKYMPANRAGTKAISVLYIRCEVVIFCWMWGATETRSICLSNEIALSMWSTSLGLAELTFPIAHQVQHGSFFRANIGTNATLNAVKQKIIFRFLEH